MPTASLPTRILGISLSALLLGTALVGAASLPAIASTVAPLNGWQCEFTDPSNTATLVTTEPCLVVSKTSDLNPLGEDVTVRGFNFEEDTPGSAATRPPLFTSPGPGKFGGTFIAVGNFADVWKPSEGAPTSSRSQSLVNWAVLNEDVATINSGRFSGGIGLDPIGGTFETTFRVDGTMSSNNFGVFTFAGGGAVVPSFELEVPLAFTPSSAPRIAIASSPAQPLPDQPFSLEVLVNPDDAGGTVTLSGRGVANQTRTVENGTAFFTIPATVGGLYSWSIAFTPTQPLVNTARTLGFSLAIDDGSGTALRVSEPAEGGFLRWGVKSSFRSYITGSIAQGSISTTDAGRTGSEFVFGQSQPVLDTDTWNEVAYRGAVSFRGHGGILNATLANPRITKFSNSQATLSVEYGGSRVSLASLNLARATTSVNDSVITYTNTPATLLVSGTTVFSFNGASFYPAGTALDSVTFSVGSVAEAITDTVVVDTYTAPEPSFAETNGAFANLANVVGACDIADASFQWGIKEAFRAYVSGAIAQGEWQLAEGAGYETPRFSFAHQSGSMNPENTRGLLRFEGLVNFTGHEGILDVSLSNPTIGIESESEAMIYLDFEGQSMDGQETSAAQLPFATLDLSSATTVREGRQLIVTEASAVLTAEGARALGAYEEGAVLDSVNFTVLTALDCAEYGAVASEMGSQDLSAAAAGKAPSPALSLGLASLLGFGGLALGGAGAWFGRDFLAKRKVRI